MSQSHRIKGGTIDEAFQEQCSLWERGASVGLTFFNLQDLSHAQETITERKEKGKNITGLL